MLNNEVTNYFKFKYLNKQFSLVGIRRNHIINAVTEKEVYLLLIIKSRYLFLNITIIKQTLNSKIS